MPPPAPSAPLPLAPDRAAVSNRISMLLASQSSVLKTMNHSRAAPTTASASAQRRAAAAADDDEDLRRGTRPNEGVGYVHDGKTTTDSKKEDQALRQRLMGKRKVGQRIARNGAGSESEEDEGRSGLGRKKRKRVREVEEEGAAHGTADKGEDEAGHVEVEQDAVDENSATKNDTPNAADAVDALPTSASRPKSKKKKKKKKKQQGTAAP